MSQGFDPYLHWLGIRDPQRPPNYYRLLGVELFESDPEVLANAADRQMAHVRNFQTGKHASESQRMLSELAAAKLCLMHPERRAEYDRRLEAELLGAGLPGQALPPAGVVPAPPVAPAVAPGAGPLGEAMPAAGEHPGAPLAAPIPLEAATPAADEDVEERREGSPVLSVVIALLLTVILVLVGLIVLVSTTRPKTAGTPGSQTVATSGGISRPPASPVAGPPRGQEPIPDTTPGKGPKPETSPTKPGKGPTSPTTPASPANPQPQPQRPPTQAPGPEGVPGTLPPAADSIRAAREAMRNRDLVAANRQLVLAQKAAFPKDQPEIDRLRNVLGPLGAFWKAVDRGLADLRPGEQLVTPGGTVSVVQVQEGSVLVREGSQEKQYAAGTLPAGLAVAIAERKLPDLPSSKLAKAAFLVMDAQGDLALAAQWCREAAEQGESTADLAAEGKLAAEERAGGTAGRLRIPEAAQVAAAMAEVREVFRDEFAKAQEPAQKGKLAQTLLAQGRETRDDPTARYVLFLQARDLAVTAGDGAVLREAVTELARHYEVDFLGEMSRVLKESAQTALPTSAKKELALTAVKMAEELIEDDRYDAASELAQAGHTMAMTRDPATAKRAADLLETLPRLKQEYAAFLAAGKVLAANADDPQANLAQGKYYCLVKNQWETGLPMLAKGSDAELKSLALAEMAVSGEATDPAEMVKLGDLWYQAATTADGFLAGSIRGRARHWYRQALPNLKGFTQKKVERRLEELGEPPAKQGRGERG